jgi:Homeodomain-like domain
MRQLRVMPNYAERRSTPQMRLVELRFGSSVPDLLRELRVEGLNVGEVAERLDVPYSTLRRWLVRFELNDASLIRKALQDGRGERR